MNIVITNRQRTKKINPHRLRLIVAALLAEVEVDDAELGIHLVGAAEMARVNWQFLQHKGSTDVITFDHTETANAGRPAASDGAAGVTRPALHGELFICVDDAISQAKTFQTRWQSEVVRYVIHGILHLLGHDDLKPEPRRRMKRAENRLVRRLAGKFSFAQLSHTVKLSA